jgi:adenylate kinase
MEVLKGHLATEGVKDNFVLDGFPRSYNQAVTLDSMLGEFGVKLDKAVFLTVDDSKVIDRITGRYHCRSCGSIYNLLYSLPKQQGICDVCGGKNFSIRDDDNKDVVRSRLKTYRESIAGVVDYYRETGILLQVDGDKHLEQVSLAIINGLGL